MIIRPAKTDDIDYIEELAKKGLSGLTTLPADRVQLFQKISDSMTAFSSKKNKPGNQCYFFVLEDTKKRKVAGTSAIIAAVGINEPFYSYKKNVVVHASNSLNIYNKYTTLHLSNDYTGCSELCTLFLDKEYRENNLGKLLSFSRFLFMAGFPDMFAEKVIAELRGESDEKGKSPFWEGFGRHFFSMDFTKADFLSGTGNKSFIAELMPRHPVYINLLSKKAHFTIVSLKNAVLSYLFNSQLVLLENDKMLLIVPEECSKIKSVNDFINELVQKENPISGFKTVDLKESMLNGGGPACLRLKVVLNQNELDAVNKNVLYSIKLESKLVNWVNHHYRDRLCNDDLNDPDLFSEGLAALDELTQILKLGSIYNFQL